MCARSSRPFANAARCADSTAVADASLKTHSSPIPACQFGKALEDAGDEAGAERAYLEVFRRSPGPFVEARRATNDLAKLYAKRGRLGEAEAVLRRGLRLWPGDEKMRHNLELVLKARGRAQEARELQKH